MALKKSPVLCAFALFTCIPAVADTATFSVAASMSITTVIITNVSYSMVLVYTIVGETANGNAGLVYDSNGQSILWTNGTLSYEFAPASGWVSSPSGGYSLFSYIYNADLQITNMNDYEVEIPITTSLITYEGDATSNGDSWSSTEAWVETWFQPRLYSPATFYIGAICSGGPGNCFAIPSQSSTVASSIPVTFTSSLLIPANSIEVLVTDTGVIGESYLQPPNPTPEPGTLTLLGSGLLGLVGFVHRRRGGYPTSRV
jgi:hypothetical protein